MTYSPQPVDTSAVSLPSDITELTEEIARHAHDVWARQRIADGWTWGAARDDGAKQHPCLVPYEELDNAEQQYDRNSTLESLKFVLSRGYRILAPSGRQHVRPGGAASEVSAAEELLDQLRAAGEQASKASSADRVALELSTLLQVWGSRREEDRAWWCLPELYRYLARRFLKLGEAPQAREVAQAALELAETDESGESYPLWKDDVSLWQIYGLALARTGNTHDAQQVLLKLKDDGHVDEETLGILARTYKDQAFLHPPGGNERRDLLNTSATFYREASAQSDGFWTGINVATLARLLDETTESESVARQVQTRCLADLERVRGTGASPEKTYWHLATLGEAALNLGDFDEAGTYYQAAYQAAPRNFGDLNTTRRQAGWLAARLLDHSGTSHRQRRRSARPVAADPACRRFRRAHDRSPGTHLAEVSG